MMNIRKISLWILLGILLLVVALLVVGWQYRVAIKEDVVSNIRSNSLPTPQAYKVVVTDNLDEEVVINTKTEVKTPAEVSLAVPFAPQAPHANWDQPYQDACEEAAVIMVERYLRGSGITLDQMDQEILKMVAWENDFFGFSKDTNIAEVKRLVDNYSPEFKASAKYDITINDIKQELIKGNPVIVLANGQLLGNPYYTQPGPEKHALVIKGFVGDDFITNDPGTRRGADFVYSAKKLLSAVVDYDGGTPGTGKKAMIVISPR